MCIRDRITALHAKALDDVLRVVVLVDSDRSFLTVTEYVHAEHPRYVTLVRHLETVHTLFLELVQELFDRYEPRACHPLSCLDCGNWYQLVDAVVSRLATCLPDAAFQSAACGRPIASLKVLGVVSFISPTRKLPCVLVVA